MDKAVMSVRMRKWAGILQEAATSGLSKVTWCEQNGINRRQFFYWQKQIREFVLEQHPELRMSVPDGQIREVNSQMTSSLPVFYELNPKASLPSAPENTTVSPFSAEAMIQLGKYQVYVGNTASERTLAMILSVIQHV